MKSIPEFNKQLDVVIFGDAVSSKNGGSASFVELCLNIKQVCNTVIATRFGIFDKFVYQHPNYTEIQKIHKSFPLHLHDRIYQSETLKHDIINRISIPKLTKKHISNCSLIIDCYGIVPEEVRAYFKTEVKIVRMHNGSVKAFSEYFGNSQKKNKDEQLFDYVEMMSKYDGLIFQSESQLYSAKAILGSKIPMVLLPPTSNESQLSKVIKLKTNRQHMCLLQIASIQPRKNQLGSLEFLSMLRDQGFDLRIKFVGPVEDEKYFGELKKFEKQHGLEGYVKYEGFQTDYYRFYKEADLVIIPSSAEGISRTLRECLFIGKPVIISEMDGTLDLIKKNVVISMDSEIFKKFDQSAVQNYFKEIVENGKLYYDQNYSLSKYQQRISDSLRLLV